MPGKNAVDPTNVTAFLDMMFKQNKIVIISATYCTFCTKIKMLLIELQERFVSLEIDVIPNGRDIFKEVVSRTSCNTVPQVFVKGKFYGGYDDLIEKQKKDELRSALAQK